MRLFYTLSMQIFQLAVKLSALFGNEKAKKWRDGRKYVFENLEKEVSKEKDLIWFHCASVGEFEQARPLIEKINAKKEFFILLSFFSPSGYESKKNYTGADHVCYLPLDTPANAKKFISICKPNLSFFAKYEFWFNYLKELSNQNCDYFLISGIFRKKQQFFRFYGKWFRDHLARFSHLYVQDKSSKELLNSFGIQQCSLSGDGRFDRVKEIAGEKAEFPLIESFQNRQTTVIFGSSWEKENQLAFELAENHPELKIIIAPHEYHYSEIDAFNKKWKKKIILYSELNSQCAENQILIIDKMGILAKIYRFADVAIIGGGFGSGIHNTLEAAVYGLPIYFGPNYHFFKEAKDLISKGGAKVFKNEKQFHPLLDEIVTNPALRSQMGKESLQYFKANVGSTELIYNNLILNNYL